MKKKKEINYKLYKNNILILDKDYSFKDIFIIKKFILKRKPDKMEINNFSLFILNENSNLDLYLPKKKTIKKSIPFKQCLILGI